MGFLTEISTGIITLAAVLTGLVALWKYARPAMQRALGITTTPADVYQLVDEVHTGVAFLVAAELARNGDEEVSPEVLAALQVLQDAGFNVSVDDE